MKPSPTSPKTSTGNFQAPNTQASSVQNKVGYGSDRAEVILKESRRGYDLIVMGASERQGIGESLFNVFVDRIVQEAPCSTMVVRCPIPAVHGEFCPLPTQPIRNILVPTVGSRASLNAVEMAGVIGVQTGAIVTLVHVVNIPANKFLFDQRTLDPILEIAREIVEYQSQVVRRLGAKVNGQILEGSSPEETILEFVQETEMDLILLGSTLRMVIGRAFVGHRVDAILRKAPCSVAVITSA